MNCEQVAQAAEPDDGEQQYHTGYDVARAMDDRESPDVVPFFIEYRSRNIIDIVSRPPNFASTSTWA